MKNALILAGEVPQTQNLSRGYHHALLDSSYLTEIFRREGKENSFDAFQRVNPEFVWAHSRELTSGFVKAVLEFKPKLILFLNKFENASEQEKNLVNKLASEGYDTGFSTNYEKTIHKEAKPWGEVGIRRTLSCLPAADLRDYFPVESKKEHSSDISYIACHERHKESKIFEYVYCLLHDFDLKIYGLGTWPVANYLGALTTEMMRTIICSTRINLSISSDEDSPSERIFKILACGKYPLILDSNHLAREIIEWGYFFDNQSQLFSQLSYLLLNEGCCDNSSLLRFVREKHSYSERLKQILGVI
jgi:hypothetical protein